MDNSTSGSITPQASMSILYNEEHDIPVEHSMVWINIDVPITVTSSTSLPTSIYMRVKYVSGQLTSKSHIDEWIDKAMRDINATYTGFILKSINITKRL